MSLCYPNSKDYEADKAMEFLRKIKIMSSGCWNWQGFTTSHHRPVIHFHGRYVYAYRFYFYMKDGIWPNLFVCHTCDNSMCVNPDHLFLGTSGDNTRDAKRKGRLFYGFKNKYGKELRDKVKERLIQGVAQRKIAKEFGMSQMTVSEINRGLHEGLL